MIITPQRAINILAENMSTIKQNQRQDLLQRRNQVVDMYGIEYYRQGDSTTPATIGISLSQDYIYLERFEFKLIISDFTSSISSMTPVTLQLQDGSITPNPHDHVIQAGLTSSPTTARNYRIYLEDVDLTPYFMAQHNMQWINGNGIYPADNLSNYDVLSACKYLKDSEVQKILSAGYRHISITADAPFNVTLVNYLKYSHVNR